MLHKNLITKKFSKRTNTTLKLYPADTVIFDRKSVSLELPDIVVTSAFSTAMKASKVLGKLIQNSFRRFSNFAELFKEFFGDALIIKDTAKLKVLNTTKPTTQINDFVVTTLEPEFDTTTLEYNRRFDETTLHYFNMEDDSSNDV